MANLEQESFLTFLLKNDQTFVTLSQFSIKKTGKPLDLNSSDQTEFCLPVLYKNLTLFVEHQSADPYFPAQSFRYRMFRIVVTDKK